MKSFGRLYDVSVILGAESFAYPGDPSYLVSRVKSIDAGDPVTLSALSTSAHAGTHLDAPAHFIAGGKFLDAYPPSRFVLPARIIEITDPQAVTRREIENNEVARGEAVLFKTENSRSGLVTRGEFSSRFVYIDGEAAQYLVEKGASLVGLDYITIDRYGDKNFTAHHVLLSNDVLLLESLNLKDVPPGRYTLIALPLRMQAMEGSPARAVLTTRMKAEE